MRRVRRPPRRRYVAATAGRQPASQSAKEVRRLSRGEVHTVISGIVFIVLVTLKLLLPEPMTGVRGTLGHWLVRDADLVSAFSAVGRAFSGEKKALEDAYTAVFGDKKAQEVANEAELELPTDADYPDHAQAEQRKLGFAYAPPLDGTVTSGFGWREHPESGAEAFHYGVDLAADEGTDITAFADGVVGVIGDSVELGRYVTVHHEGGILTLYAHCSRIVANSGSRVSCGDKLAEVGQTGNATGPHLHFEIRDGEEWLDPQRYL